VVVLVVLSLHRLKGRKECNTLLLAIELSTELDEVRGDIVTLGAKYLGFDFVHKIKLTHTTDIVKNFPDFFGSFRKSIRKVY